MMTRIELRGLFKVTAKGRTYWYAWRGGPRLRGEPGSPEFIASYNEAIAAARAPDTSKFRGVVAAYRASRDYQKLADSTKKNWTSWLDRIADYFGNLSIRQFDRPEKIRPVIRRWRAQWEDKPRTADYGLQVLSCVLSHAVDPLGKIAGNPCEGIRRLYSGDRSEIIWTDVDISEFKMACSPELADAVDLAAYTGLRLSDLIRLAWSHIDGDAIVLDRQEPAAARGDDPSL
jgi:integrase